MPRAQDIDYSGLDYAALGNKQRAWVLRQATEKARIERSLALRRALATLAAGVRKAVAAVAEWHAGYRWRRRRRSVAATLRALPDRTLKDIGIARCEIDRLAATDWQRAA